VFSFRVSHNAVRPPPSIDVTPAPADTQRHSLSRTLPVSVLLFAVVPLVIAGLLTLTEGAQRLRTEQELRARQTAALLAGRVEQLLVSAERLAGMIAASPMAQVALQLHPPPNPAANEPQVHVDALGGEWLVLVRSFPEVDQVELLDPQGRPVQSHPPRVRQDDAPRTLPATGDRWRARAGTGSVDVWAPVPGGAGWVSVGLSAAAIAQALGLPPQDAGEVRALLRNPQGRALSLVRRVASAPVEVQPLPVLEALPAAGRDTGPLVASAGIGDSGWQVEVQASLDAYRSLVYAELLRFGAVVLAISLLSAWLAWRFARSLAQAIREVARSARAILRGHYLNAHVHLQRDDEIGLLAQSFNHMSHELEQRERERDVFGRLVSPEVRDQLVQGELVLGGHEVEVTVLFSDIRGFTQLCEGLKPRDVVLTLNEHFTRMTHAVQRFGGYVNNYMGDAMVVVFGAPTPDPHRVERALYAAANMHQALEEFNRERAGYGAAPLSIGIGLASGTALAGQIGSPERCIYTVIGDTVNIAARIEGLAKEETGMVAFVNQATHDLLPRPLRECLRPLGARTIKGRDSEILVWGLPEDAELPAPALHLLRPEEEVL
jgi:class 3 adenylate cyclase